LRTDHGRIFIFIVLEVHPWFEMLFLVISKAVDVFKRFHGFFFGEKLSGLLT